VIDVERSSSSPAAALLAPVAADTNENRRPPCADR